jgi:LuxR family maltose regulon positive regulatory protein
VISAAAGSGKTTLLCEWIDSLATERYVWLTLDEDNNDPVRFWRYLLTALATLSPDLDTQLLPLLPAMQSDHYFLTTLVNRLNATLNPATVPALLFLEDYHVITTPILHHALGFLVEHLEHLHIVLSTRADPPLRLALLRGRGQLLELRDADLRFTTEESAVFLRECFHLMLTPEEHTLLYTQTEGWVTGLQLAALILQDQTHLPRVLQTLKGSHRYILEYLTDEVLQEQLESIRIFLLHTSILERLSASLCDALCQQQNSQEMLSHLEQKNIFLIPLDDERQWFRYHHLFADVLRIHLRQMPPEQRNALHLRASEWYEQHGYRREAIHHALEAQHWLRAASLLEPIARSLIWTYGEVITIQRWIEQIPLDLVRIRPRLCLAYAWLLLLRGSPTDIEGWLDAAASAPAEAAPFTEVDLYQQRSHTSTVHSQISALRALLSGLRGDSDQTLALCERAYTQIAPDDYVHLAVVQNAEGLALQAQGQVEPACARILAASQNMLIQGVHSSANILLDYAAQTLVIQGKLHEAWQVAQQAIRLGSTPNGPTLPNACYAYATSASILAEWNDLDGALAAITQGIVQGEQTGNTDFLCDGYPTLMSISLARGSFLEAQTALAQAEEVARKRDITLKQASIATARASLWLAEGRLEEVARWQKRRQQQKQPIPLLLAEMLALIDARYALLTRQPQEALAILDPLLPAAEAGKRGDRVLKILLLQTLAYQALKSEQAGTCLERLLPLAEREGYLRIFLDTGMPPDRLFAHLPEHLRTSMTVRAVLHAWRQPSLNTSFPSYEDRSIQPLLEPLSPREREILHLIASGASNQEIAETLVIAPNTVKRHIGNILAKLGVSNRTQALVQARKIGLIS